MNRIAALFMLSVSLLLSGCGYNALQSQDEQIQSAWSEVLNQYQRRADLVPNLVNTVKGFAAQEERVFTEVTNARARVGQVQVSPGMVDDPAALQRFGQAQGELSGALSRLLVVAENYPQLKSDGLFRDLQAQLEGTENRINVARRDYNEAVRVYNTSVRRFPTNMLAGVLGFRPRTPFEAVPGAEQAPVVDFS
jgi:LemA protein